MPVCLGSVVVNISTLEASSTVALPLREKTDGSSSIGSGGYRRAALASSMDSVGETKIQLSSVQFTRNELLDSLSYRTITVGFLLLTVGIISGAVWANTAGCDEDDDDDDDVLEPPDPSTLTSSPLFLASAVAPALELARGTAFSSAPRSTAFSPAEGRMRSTATTGLGSATGLVS